MGLVDPVGGDADGGDWLDGLLRDAFRPDPGLDPTPEQLQASFDDAVAQANLARVDPRVRAELDAILDEARGLFDEAAEIVRDARGEG